MDIESAKLLGAGIAVLGVIGSGIGIGSIFSAFITAVGRNPEAREHVFTMTMLGFALVEALALFALIIALLLLFVFWVLWVDFYSRLLLFLIFETLTVLRGKEVCHS